MTAQQVGLEAGFTFGEIASGNYSALIGHLVQVQQVAGGSVDSELLAATEWRLNEHDTVKIKQEIEPLLGLVE